MNLVRYGAAFGIGLAVVTSLFAVMQLLIATGQNAIVDRLVSHRVAIGDVQMASEPEEPEETVTRPERLVARPPVPRVPQVYAPRQVRIPVTFNYSTRFVPEVRQDEAGNYHVGALTEGDPWPIVRVQPVYPKRAQERGIEGYCIVMLTVTPTGTTENIRVVDANPEGVFDQASIRAAESFQYKPKIVNGKAVPVPGVLYKFTYELSKAR